MTSRQIEIGIDEASEFRSLISDQLKKGLLRVPTEETFELYDDVKLRITVEGRSLDVAATVVNPAIPVGNGVFEAGLEVRLTRAEWTGLEWLLNILVRKELARKKQAAQARKQKVSSATTSAESEQETPVAVEAARVSQSFKPIGNKVEEPSSEEEAFGRPTTAMFSGEHLAVPGEVEPEVIDYPDYEEESEEVSEETGPSQRFVEDTTGSRKLDGTADASQTIDAMPFSRVDSAVGSEVPLDDESSDGTIPIPKPLANPRMASSKEASDYRAANPEKASRAEEYFLQALQSLRMDRLNQARTSISLAIAYNPTEQEYRELLAVIDTQMDVQS